MKNISFIAAIVFVVLLLNLGYSAKAVLLSIVGLVVLAYVSWNFFNRNHNWFTFTMCTGFGSGILYGFYCVLSMPWFYALSIGMVASALLGCIYRKIHYC